MKIINVLWFSEMGNQRPIGIVIGEDEVTKEKKAYIGTANGASEELDAKHIATHGAKFPLEILK